ncbi:hypothetical protein GBAR_LOCUS12200, partial [Geodia barretti]
MTTAASVKEGQQQGVTLGLPTQASTRNYDYQHHKGEQGDQGNEGVQQPPEPQRPPVPPAPPSPGSGGNTYIRW